MTTESARKVNRKPSFAHGVCTRWIAACVDMLDHPVVGMYVPPPKPADKTGFAQQPMAAWLDLLMAASWRTATMRVGRSVLTLERGQFPAARSYWAKRWNWGEQAVRGFFARLADHEMIAFCNQSDGHVPNVASICNYDVYQSRTGAERPVEQPEPNQSPTSNQPHCTSIQSYKDTKEEKSYAPQPSAADAKPKKASRGSRLAEGMQLPDEWKQWALATFPGVTLVAVAAEFEKFHDYWIAQAGQKGVKLNWFATWKNWCRAARERTMARNASRNGKVVSAASFDDMVASRKLLDEENRQQAAYDALWRNRR